MPVPPTWMPRLAEILDATRKLGTHDLDRTQIMRLFGLQRRAALLLIVAFGIIWRSVSELYGVRS